MIYRTVCSKCLKNNSGVSAFYRLYVVVFYGLSSNRFSYIKGRRPVLYVAYPALLLKIGYKVDDVTFSVNDNQVS